MSESWGQDQPPDEWPAAEDQRRSVTAPNRTGLEERSGQAGPPREGDRCPVCDAATGASTLLDSYLQVRGRLSGSCESRRLSQPASMIDGDDPVMRRLARDEAVRGVVDGIGGRLFLTDRRVLVTENGVVTLDVPIENLRLVEFDVERQRPARVIIVPEQPRDPPLELAIEPQQYDEVAAVLAQLGPRIQGPSPA
jgi:hypothetical protein